MGEAISGKQLNPSAMIYQAECLELSSGEMTSEGWMGRLDLFLLSNNILD